VNWQPTADGTGYVCTRHGETFARAEVCQACATDPGDGPGETFESEEVDRRLMRLANEFRGHGRAMWNAAHLRLKGTETDQNTAAKLSAEAVKWQRLALELEDKVSARDHDRKLIRHEREMSALRGTH